MKSLLPYLMLATSFTANAGVFPDYGYSPPEKWTGERFTLSQDYPQSLPTTPAEGQPWSKVDPEKEPAAYLDSVINYCLDGFDTKAGNFNPTSNTKRKWYHAPWMHYGPSGREFVHGMTPERSSRKFELGPHQTDPAVNFAVGLYNDLGGFTLGEVWRQPLDPDIGKARFPEGTVSFKLLFTTAPVDQVPYLRGSPEWIADISRSPDPAIVAGSKVRLLQIDIAVRDQRSKCGGWIFGTFHYDASVPQKDAWRRLRPLTLLWGNDPALTPALNQAGTKPAESWINEASPVVEYRRSLLQSATVPPVLGWAGRGNGPVDNPQSSCLSCHMTAQLPTQRIGMAPGANLEDSEKLKWFRNLAPNEAFSAGSLSLDFSLQLGVGIQRCFQFKNVVASMGGFRSSDAPLAPPAAIAGRAAAVGNLPPDLKGRNFDLDLFLKGEIEFTRDPDSR